MVDVDYIDISTAEARRMVDGTASGLEAEMAGHRDFLVRIARLQLRDPVIADDVVQETLAAALAGRDRFAGRSNVRTWLVGILKLKVIDVLRERRHRVVAIEPAEESLADIDVFFRADGHFVEPPLEWRGPAEALQEQRFLSAVDLCLDRLPPNSARVFVMREVMELETAEIAAELALTANHVGVLLCRARMLLRKCLELGWFSGEAA
jgi:RNA polymerase sigma-70 factor, ECF subfamily